MGNRRDTSFFYASPLVFSREIKKYYPDLSEVQIKEITNEFILYILDKMIDTGKVQVPNLGSLAVRSYPKVVSIRDPNSGEITYKSQMNQLITFSPSDKMKRLTKAARKKKGL